MANIKPEELWFNTPDTFSLCRGGSNGPAHISQLYAIKKYVFGTPLFLTFLDYGCGSGTTYEAIQRWYEENTADILDPLNEFKLHLPYIGLDIIPKNVEWCRENFPQGNFYINHGLHIIDEPDKSFDVVYSRHVVDHMESFEKAMDEHKRVAKKLVIVILWTGLVDGDEHEIKNIVDQRGLPTEKLYPNEYTNNYSRKKVTEYLNSDSEWELLELNENVGNNQVIVLKRV